MNEETLRGRIKDPCHVDVIYFQASLEVDGLMILEEGRLLV